MARARWRPSTGRPPTRRDPPGACATSRSASSCRAQSNSSVGGRTRIPLPSRPHPRRRLQRDPAHCSACEIHRKTAEWLASLSPDRAADRAEMLAHHSLECAYELTPAPPEAMRRRSSIRPGTRSATPATEPSASAPSRLRHASSGQHWTCGRTTIVSVRCCSSASGSRPTTPRRRARRSSRMPAMRCSRRAIAARRRRPRRSRQPRLPPGDAPPGLRAPRSGRRAGRRTRADPLARRGARSTLPTTCPWPGTMRARSPRRRRRSRSRERSACARSRPPRYTRSGSPGTLRRSRGPR